MPKPNTTCQCCGKKYYICKACVDIYSWKLVACSTECFQKLVKAKAESSKPSKKKAKTEK